MGVGDVYTIASSIDGNWLAWSITYYFWDVIGLGFLVLVFGGILGATGQYFRLYKKVKSEEKIEKELSEHKSEITELNSKISHLNRENHSLRIKLKEFEDKKVDFYCLNKAEIQTVEMMLRQDQAVYLDPDIGTVSMLLNKGILEFVNSANYVPPNKVQIALNGTVRAQINRDKASFAKAYKDITGKETNI